MGNLIIPVKPILDIEKVQKLQKLQTIEKGQDIKIENKVIGNHDDIFKKILFISNKLLIEYNKNFLDDDFCSKLVFIYEKKLSNFNIKLLKSLYNSINSDKVDNNVLLTIQDIPKNDDKFNDINNIFKDTLKENFFGKNTEYDSNDLNLNDDIKIDKNNIESYLKSIKYINPIHVNKLLNSNVKKEIKHIGGYINSNNEIIKKFINNSNGKNKEVPVSMANTNSNGKNKEVPISMANTNSNGKNKEVPVSVANTNSNSKNKEVPVSGNKSNSNGKNNKTQLGEITNNLNNQNIQNLTVESINNLNHQNIHNLTVDSVNNLNSRNTQSSIVENNTNTRKKNIENKLTKNQENIIKLQREISENQLKMKELGENNPHINSIISEITNKNINNKTNEIISSKKNSNNLYVNNLIKYYNPPKYKYGVPATFCKINEKCELNKSQLCQAISENFIVRNNIIAAILTVIPFKNEDGIYEGGICYQKFLNIDKCQICVPYDYKNLKNKSIDSVIKDILNKSYNLTENKCKNKNGYFLKLTDTEIENLIEKSKKITRDDLLMNPKIKYNVFFLELREKLKKTYFENLNSLIKILEKIEETPLINNKTLNLLSDETKKIIDKMYNLCHYYYIYAIIALINSDIKTDIMKEDELETVITKVLK